MFLWPGATTSPSAVSKSCGILGNGQAMYQSLILPLYNFDTKLKCKIGDIEISNLNVFEDLY